MFRPAEIKKLFCVFHKDNRAAVLNELQTLGLVEFFDVLENYPDLDRPETYTIDVAIELNRVSQLLIEATPLYGRKVSFTEHLLGPKMLPLTLLPKRTYEVLEVSRARLDEIEEEFESLLGKSKKNFRQKYRFELHVLKEELENAYERMKAAENFVTTKDTLILGCWVESHNVSKVIRALNRATQDSCSITIEDPLPGESVPIALRNPGVLKPYELLSKAYGLPKYRELDPTPILALTFTLFFGIMFADIGYGLLIILLGLSIVIWTRKSSEPQRNINLLIIYGGMASVVFGFLFGEFFGGMIHLGPNFIGSDILGLIERLLLLTISIGVVHISISLISRLISAIISKEDLLYPAAMLVILGSCSALALSLLRPLPSWSIILAELLLVGGLFSLMKAKGIEAFVEIITLFTNILSYVRLAAVLVIHIVVARLLYEQLSGIPRTVTGLVLGIIGFVSGAALILAAGVLMTFVQSLRLHWIEFFNRFYSGTGESFKYFIRKSKYTRCY